jgi:hypothetical protein
LPATWGRRNTKHDRYSNSAWFNTVGPLGTEGIYRVWPIHGRKYINVVCRAINNGSFRVRLATVGEIATGTYGIESQIAPGGYPTTTPIPPSGQVKFDLTLASRATFLILYAARTGPAVPVLGDSLYVDFSARDA